MNEEFIKDLYKVIIKETHKGYITLFKKTKIDDFTIDYWKNSLNFYNHLNNDEKKIFFEIIEQVMIDTVSNIFNILDNNLYDYKIDIKINNTKSNNCLQDIFLSLVEESRS